MAEEKIDKNMENIEEFVDSIKDDKTITQDDSIDPSVEAYLQEMGFLWERVQSKLKADSHCFACKTTMTDEEKVHLVEAGKVEKGVIAFVSVCEKCFLEQKAKEEEGKKEND